MKILNSEGGGMGGNATRNTETNGTSGRNLKNVPIYPKLNNDICQCPKCLEVQESNEVCIKCGLIFDKYYKSKLIRNSNSSKLNKNKTILDYGLQTKNLFDPRMQKVFNKITKTVYFYLLFAVMISIFDLGNLVISKNFCEVVKILVPSLKNTTIISKDPNNTCLILAISWTMSILMIAILSNWLIKKPITNSVIFPSNCNLKTRLMSLVLFCSIVTAFYLNAPSHPEAGRISKFVYSLLNSGTITSAIWGLVIYLQSVFTFMLIITFVVEFIEKINSNN
ncbi:hypothetical protein [Pelotalea chapellei]|uniref:Uncharacterized protein n=1 Tax=Pelotalea chapellei TaxID=44671 RepID=A0ABS5U5Y8_9BACT|nr:hypothetical protein [Pelotalea chapellei]MBT1071067.1 hypothetical protein [Pelotalea chapellei]